MAVYGPVRPVGGSRGLFAPAWGIGRPAGRTGPHRAAGRVSGFRGAMGARRLCVMDTRHTARCRGCAWRAVRRAVAHAGVGGVHVASPLVVAASPLVVAAFVTSRACASFGAPQPAQRRTWMPATRRGPLVQP